MEKLFIKNIKYLFVFSVALLLWSSCKKENSGVDNPTIINGPDSASAGGIVILEGSDLAEVESIIFENGSVPANFNPVLNNPNAILFRVPDTAWGGPTKIILTNKVGKQFTHPIVVVTPAVVSSVSVTDYMEGSHITLIGSNLLDVTEVALVDMEGEPLGLTAEIISQTKKEMLIAMPASTDLRVKLRLTNSSSSIVASMEFVNIDNARKVFTDAYATRMENWSWGGTQHAISTEDKIMGTSSIRVNFTTASRGDATRIVNQQTIPFENFTHVSFWIKGADVPVDYSFCLQKSASESVLPQSFTVPANKWVYMTFPLDIWKNEGMTFAWSLVWQLQSPSGSGKVTYLDNIVFN
jgi:hypothetical protein